MSMEVTVGAFMFMVLLALGVFTIFLSGENIFSQTVYTEVVFDDVIGLRKGDNVMVRGLEVGKVSDVRLGETGVHVRLETEIPLIIYRDYMVEILPSSVLGGHYLQIYQGTPEAGPVAPDTVFEGTTPVYLIDQATETSTALREALIEGGILENLEESMEDIRSMVKTLNKTITDEGGTIGKLLNDDDAYNKFMVVVDNLQEISGGLKKGEGSLGRLLKDDQLSRDVEITAANFRALSDRLVRGDGTVGELLSGDETLYLDFRDAVAAMKKLMVDLQSGKGTLGRLASDDSLYEEAQLLLEEIRATVDDLRETAPITTFSSIFFGAF